MPDVPPAQVALVTGASRGIGRAIAMGLAGRGLRVGLLARDETALAEVAREITEAGGIASVAAADVTDPAEVDSAVAGLADALGPIDLLVNNAGAIDAEVPLWQADPVQWQRVLTTNVVGVFHVMHRVLAGMVARGGGRTVELASGAGTRDWEVASAYTVSKTALIRMTGHVHEAGFALGLRSFAIAPGVVDTSMTRGMQVHAGRSEFTPVARTVDLVAAIAAGELDDWSGRYLRVTHDTRETLQQHGPPMRQDRRLGIIAWGPDDPALGG